jgi:hypothetical protein
MGFPDFEVVDELTGRFIDSADLNPSPVRLTNMNPVDKLVKEGAGLGAWGGQRSTEA